jgi:sulfite reductase beta subunit-like hemoprotein
LLQSREHTIMSTSTSTLIDLSKETSKFILDAIAENNRRSVAYAKNVWGVVARPYAGNDLKINISDTIERVEKIVDLAMSDFEVTSKATIDLVEKVASQAEKAREESLQVARSYAKTGVTTMKHALETTEERLETLAKRLEETVAEVNVTAKKAAKAS